MTTTYRSTAVNVWSNDKETTHFKIDPNNTHTNIFNDSKRVDILTQVRILDVKNNAITDPISYADELMKDASGVSIDVDKVNLLVHENFDADGKLVSDPSQIETNKQEIQNNSTDIADLLARVIALEAQMAELQAP